MGKAKQEEGRYDALAEYVLEKSRGMAAVVIVVNGSRGNGVTIKEDFSLLGTRYHVTKLPTLLRRIAQEIEEKGYREGEK